MFQTFLPIGRLCKFGPETKELDELESVAFRNTDGQLVTVVMNRTDREIPYVLRLEGRLAPLTIAPHAIQTLLVDAK